MSEANGYAKPDELFRPIAREFFDVEVESLGKFRMRTLTAKEAAEFSAAKFDKLGQLSRNGLIKSNALAIQMVCVDGEGNQVFSRGDVEKIQELPAGPVSELAQACMKHSGLADEDEAKN